MSKTKVLVTGANGYIGRHVVEQLLNMGADVLAADFSFDGVDERAQRVETPIFKIFMNRWENRMYAFILPGETDLFIMQILILKIFRTIILS